MLLTLPLARKCVVGLLCLGGLGYADWILQFFLPISTSPVTSYVSELSADGQPFADVFRNTDMISGAFIMLGAVGAWLLLRRWSPVWIALFMLGVSNMLEATTPMRCVITFAANCTPPEPGSLFATVVNPHAWVSVLQTVSCFSLIVFGTVALRRAQASPIRWRLLTAIGMLALFISLIEGLFTVELLVHSSDSVLGMIQRTEVTFTALWLALAPGSLLLLGVGRATGRLPDRQRGYRVAPGRRTSAVRAR
ncbi:MAG: putative rane protein [Marmoricola sp.]|nr:putative rane protein [Marmoricola sp.]